MILRARKRRSTRKTWRWAGCSGCTLGTLRALARRKTRKTDPGQAYRGRSWDTALVSSAPSLTARPYIKEPFRGILDSTQLAPGFVSLLLDRILNIIQAQPQGERLLASERLRARRRPAGQQPPGHEAERLRNSCSHSAFMPAIGSQALNKASGEKRSSSVIMRFSISAMAAFCIGSTSGNPMN